MDRLREKIADGWVLTSIENMLKTGVMEDGIVKEASFPLYLPTLSETSSTRGLKSPQQQCTL